MYLTHQASHPAEFSRRTSCLAAGFAPPSLLDSIFNGLRRILRHRMALHFRDLHKAPMRSVHEWTDLGFGRHKAMRHLAPTTLIGAHDQFWKGQTEIAGLATYHSARAYARACETESIPQN